MVITIKVANFVVKKVLIDQGSSVNILYMSTFKHLQIHLTEIQPYHKQLVGFSGKQVDIQGYVDLLTTFDEGKSIQTISTGTKHLECHSLHATHGHEVPLFQSCMLTSECPNNATSTA
ncbi:hypothetical protein CR513_58424, partial [Mucuna pruriens]